MGVHFGGVTHLAQHSVASPPRLTPALSERAASCAGLFPRELALLLAERDLRILDVRRRVLSLSGGSVTIPGALRLHPDSLSGAHGQALSTLELAYTMSRAGVGDHQRLVFFDEDGRSGAARLAAKLRAAGHSTASALEGGFRRWERERLPTASEWTVHPPASFTARVGADLDVPAAASGRRGAK